MSLNPKFDPYEYAAELLESQISPMDPVHWCKKKAGIQLWSKQQDIVRSVQNNRLTAVKSGHGIGKSFTTAMIAGWWVDTHPYEDTVVVSTAPSTRQVSVIMWAEIRKLHRHAKLAGEVQRADRWIINDTEVAFGRKPQDYDKYAFQGIHNKYVLVIIDEACHDDRTDVLTDSGWMRFSDLTGSEKLLTMDSNTHEASYTFPTKIVAKPYQGPMHYYSAKGMNYAVTPDHQMLYGQKQYHNDGQLSWRKSQKQDIESWNNKYVKKVIDWHVDDNDSLSDDFLSLMGWFGSEGHVNKAVNFVNFTQSADRNEYYEIIRLCERLGYDPKVYGNDIRIHNTELAKFFIQWGRTQLERRVPDVVRMSSARQINIYLDAYSAGDGYHKSNGREIIYTSSPDMSDDLQELVLKTGMPSVVQKRALEGKSSVMPDGHTATSTTDGYVVSRPSRRSDAKMYNENEEIRDYDGMVYCATVSPNHLLFTRRNGYTMWSGNCGVDEWLWISALSIATGEYCRIIAIGNPDDPSSYFARVCKPESGWNVIQISVLDSPHFTGEQITRDAADKLTNQSYLDDMRKEVGEGSPIWTSKVLGEFPEVDEFSVIPQAWVHRAQERWREWKLAGSKISEHDRLVVGADIARFGGDKTAFANKVGEVVTTARLLPKIDTEKSADELSLAVGTSGTAIIDTNGVGAGVYDKMKRRGRHAIGVNPAARTQLKDSTGKVEFYNLRAAMTWRMRELLDPSRDSTLMLPAEDENGSVKLGERIAGDLSAPRWSVAAGGKIVIENKADLKKRIGRSPDLGDAVTLACWIAGNVTTDVDESAFNWVLEADYDSDDAVWAVGWQENEDDWRQVSEQQGVPII